MYRAFDDSAAGRYWLVEGGNVYHHPALTMLSPHILCDASLERVRAFFERTAAASGPRTAENSECNGAPHAFDRLTIATPTPPTVFSMSSHPALSAGGIATGNTKAATKVAVRHYGGGRCTR
jgi:hypothetical protein